ncbi:MAG: hypothetical protein JWQ51_176, partial [Tardiphaga sp.]|nr:hypothetical protein [Tardiphaga sp.]
MSPGENRILELVTMKRDLRSSSGAFPFRLSAEFMGEPAAKRWLIKGVFAKGESSAWIAPPGGMKSALLASAAVSVARGSDWFGRRNKGAAGVVYFALERADLVERRIRAEMVQLGLDALPIAVVSITFDLVKPESINRVIATIRDAEACFGIPVGLAIFDTHAKIIAAGGGDENLAKDQGAVFANLQRIKNTIDLHVAIIGHSGKDQARGARGSNAFLGDVDVMVTISGDEIKTAMVTKANDAPEGPLFSFKSTVHEFGTDEDGDPITVNIVSGDDVSESTLTVSGDPKLTPNQRVMFRLLY